jgi:hypothetical protein
VVSLGDKSFVYHIEFDDRPDGYQFRGTLRELGSEIPSGSCAIGPYEDQFP